MRSNLTIGDTPGPGQYYPKDSNNPHFAFSKEPRSKDLKGGDPGPGRNFFMIQSTKYLLLYLPLLIICWTPRFTNRTFDNIDDDFFLYSKNRRFLTMNRQLYGKMYNPNIVFEEAKST